MKSKIRQPIVTVAGHVDHGKTSLLDRIRGTSVAKKEPGLITQTISCTILPASQIKNIALHLLKRFNINLKIPGFLLIDTPGHAAFTNLRKRGGSLADIVILVIDIREGLMEQTVESINILKEQKVPFVVALNKIDAISGWQKKDEDLSKNIKMQSDYVKRYFEAKLYNIVSRLSEFGFDSDLFERISDFTKQIPLVPVSAKTGEGLPELLVMLAGLSQKFLEKRLSVKGSKVRGTILEVKKERGITFLETIIYEGTIKQNSTIIIGSFDEPIKTKIRAIFEALPLAKGFKAVNEAHAATFVRLQTPVEKEVLPGMPIIGLKSDDKEEIEKTKEEVKKEISEIIKLDKEGVVIKANSLGGLEALIFQLKKLGIKIGKAGIGNITKIDVMYASSMEPIDRVVIGFNVDEEIEGEKGRVKIIRSSVIYKLIEKLQKWREEKEKELLRESLSVTMPCKIKVLPYIFRKNKPAIFGIRVETGKLKTGLTLMNKEGKKIDEIKSMQLEGKSIDEATKGQEVAIALPKITIGRQVKEGEELYSVITEEEFKKLKENRKYLNSDELSVLQEILEIMRKKNPLWGI